MEDLVLPPCHKQTTQNSRRSIPRVKDIWLAVRDGSVYDVDAALSLLKKNGGNVNARNLFGLTPLHIATWRNHAPIVRRLLEAGADPDARDGESGWSSLHRALHFGHLAIANILLQSGASLILEDSKSRTTVDLLSGPVLQAIGKDSSSMATEVFSWGSGVNYQLGTGNAHIQKLPCKVDSLHGSLIKLISAAKFHSIAVTARGEVYTWGFGRGGRLGHPDFDIHSGQAAIITPRLVTSGLGARRVKAVAAAKHHTAVVTEAGEVFTWGSNREGQLGYTSVDTQPTPRRVSSLKTRIMAVAAANKHTAVVSEAGEVYTWGCNKEGQLGYGTSNSASNYTPRVVEYLKGKIFVSVSAAKYHTIVLGSDGEVFTWGHRLVTPRRVIVARNIKKVGNPVLKFHRAGRLNVVSVAAGMKHSLALTDDGALFYWASSDPDLQCHQLYELCGRSIVSMSAGKYWTAAVSATGDVYTWDAKKGNKDPPTFSRLHGVKKATSVAVGETHLLVLSTLYHPHYEPSIEVTPQKFKENEELDELNEGFMFDEGENNVFSNNHEDDIARCAKPGLRNSSDESSVPSLKSLCEKVAAEHLVEPRNAIQLLEIADSLGADDLKKHCEEITLRNLDYILTVSLHAFLGTSLDILVELEKLLDLKSSEPWSWRRLPTPTAPFPVIIESEEEDHDNELRRIRNHGTETVTFTEGGQMLHGFLQSNDGGIEGVSKQIRALRKKLQQIEMLEQKQTKGHLLDNQQIAKLQMRSELEIALAELGVPSEKLSAKVDERESKRGGSRKQRRKTKQRDSHKGEESTDFAPESGSGTTEVPIDVKDIPIDVKVSEQLNTEKIADFESGAVDKDSTLSKSKETVEENPQNKTALPMKSKKKCRKGGLSMFLSGALDEVPKQPSPPVVKDKTDAPAWGGAKISKELTSLRYIQDEQSKTKVTEPSRTKEVLVDSPSAVVSGKVPLGSFLCSSPKPMVSNKKPQVSDGDKNTPPWTASVTPPSLSRPSLRDIQLQQGKHHGVSHVPSTRTTGFSVSPGHGSPSEPVINRWFKPEAEAASSIRSIQIEEKAMKDLRRFYSSVRIVSNQQP